MNINVSWAAFIFKQELFLNWNYFRQKLFLDMNYSWIIPEQELSSNRNYSWTGIICLPWKQILLPNNMFNLVQLIFYIPPTTAVHYWCKQSFEDLVFWDISIFLPRFWSILRGIPPYRHIKNENKFCYLLNSFNNLNICLVRVQ